MEQTMMPGYISDKGSPADSRPSILIVDDEPWSIDLLADILTADYRILSASTGSTALALAAGKMPDLILLDVMMREMDGYEVCKRLQEEPKTSLIPVIFVTMLGDATAEVHGLSVGAVDYITKPINPTAVRARVSNQIRLKQAHTKLCRQELDRRDVFLARVSHELRSPIAAIQSFNSIIADGVAGITTHAQDTYLKIIERNIQQLRAIVDDLLQVAQGRTGKLEIKLEPVSISEALLDAFHTFQNAATAKGIALVVDPANCEATVYADPTRLRQILTILLDNALKFTPPKGEIKIQSTMFKPDPIFLQVGIVDSGCGISPAMTARIFEYLSAVPTLGEEGRKGLGLGLYIAQDLVNRHDGELWVESRLREGSKFYFTLRIAPDPLFEANSR
jgi:signal transduction histidine kinase